MASELSIQSLLITTLLFALIVRLILLWVFEGNRPFYKMDLALYVLSFLLSAVLTGLFWSKQPLIWIEILLGVLSIIPSIQTLLRIGCQQLNNPFIKRPTRVVFRVCALTSTVSKILIKFIGTFTLDGIHCIIPFLLFLDHLSEVAWYIWLIKGATQGRKKPSVILAHLSNLGIILLGVAILGAISKVWVIALELIICAMWAIYIQSVHCVMCKEGFYIHHLNQYHAAP